MSDYYDRQETYTFTIRPGNWKVAEVAKWVRERSKVPLGDAVQIAKTLIGGGEWAAEYMATYKLDELNSPCILTVVTTPSRYDINQQEQEQLRKLLEAGAEGDFAAAVEYCKAELANKVNHGAMG